MRLFKLLIILLTVSVLTNCSKDEAQVPTPDDEDQIDEQADEPEVPEPEVYFTLNTFIPPNSVEESENWVIVHDANGKLLDHSSYQAGDKIEFEAIIDSLTQYIAVTYLRYTETDGNKNHFINTSTNVEKGTIENFGPYELSEQDDPMKTGEFDIVVEKIPNPDGVAYPVKVEVSTGIGRLGGGSGGIGYPSGIQLTLTGRPKYEGHDDYLISILDGDNILKYYYFDNPNTQNFTLDYTSDFTPFETDISISLPEHNSYNLNVAGFKEDQEFSQYGGYWLHDVISVLNSDVKTNPLRIGYIDAFSKYRTQFNINMTGYSYSVVKYGTGLEELSIPERPQLDIVDSSINNFIFNVDITFDQANHSWSYDEGSYSNNDYSRTAWGFTAVNGLLPTIGEIPTEIIEKYPSMNIEEMTYTTSRFHLPLLDAEYNSSQTITVFNN